jgi:hypothetical protein
MLTSYQWVHKSARFLVSIKRNLFKNEFEMFCFVKEGILIMTIRFVFNSIVQLYNFRFCAKPLLGDVGSARTKV